MLAMNYRGPYRIRADTAASHLRRHPKELISFAPHAVTSSW